MTTNTCGILPVGEIKVPITETCSIHNTEFLNVTGQTRYDCPQCLQTEIRAVQLQQALREGQSLDAQEMDAYDSRSLFAARLMLVFMVFMPLSLVGGILYALWRG